MDRSSETTDAFCEVRFGSEFYKTDVCRKSLNPVWNSDWFRFDVNDIEIQVSVTNFSFYDGEVLKKRS